MSKSNQQSVLGLPLVVVDDFDWEPFIFLQKKELVKKNTGLPTAFCKIDQKTNYFRGWHADDLRTKARTVCGRLLQRKARMCVVFAGKIFLPGATMRCPAKTQRRVGLLFGQAYPAWRDENFSGRFTVRGRIKITRRWDDYV
jgi:hypothetical protein